jgi:hypothetical protein
VKLSPTGQFLKKRIDVIPHCIEKETLKNPRMGKKTYISPFAVYRWAGP